MAKSIPYMYGIIALSEEDKEKIREAWANGSTHAVFASDRMDDIRVQVKKLEELYQRLEVTDDIDELNPAFDMMCEFTEKFYIILEDLKSLTDYNRYMHIKANMSSLYGSTSGSTQGSI